MSTGSYFLSLVFPGSCILTLLNDKCLNMNFSSWFNWAKKKKKLSISSLPLGILPFPFFHYECIEYKCGTLSDLNCWLIKWCISAAAYLFVIADKHSITVITLWLFSDHTGALHRKNSSLHLQFFIYSVFCYIYLAFLKFSLITLQLLLNFSNWEPKATRDSFWQFVCLLDVQ